MDGKRAVRPGALIAGWKRYLCVRRLLSEFDGQTATTSLKGKRRVGVVMYRWLLARNVVRAGDCYEQVSMGVRT